MKIQNIIWLEDIIEKLDRKHDVQPWEVEGVLENHPDFYFILRLLLVMDYLPDPPLL